MAGFFDILFGGGAEKEAADKDRAAASLYQNQGLQALQSGYSTGSGAINSAIAGYTPLANLGQTYSAGAPTLMDALGVNGAQGTQRAQQAFNAGPGYQWQLGQGLDALARRRGASGMGQTGNADIDAMTYASGLADQSYQSWLKNLMTTGGMGITATNAAAGGQAGQYDALAKLAAAYAGDQTGVYGNTMQTNVGANNLQAAGEAAGAKNLLNFGVNLASMAMGMPPMGGSGGGSSFMNNMMGSSPSYGGGNFLSGDAWGGSSSNPLPGLTKEDYGVGF